MLEGFREIVRACRQSEYMMPWWFWAGGVLIVLLCVLTGGAR